jgi:hypothetical protein
MGVGLFGVAGGLIRDVLVVNATVAGGVGVGGLVGDNVEQSTVSNCYCSGDIAGDERVGGLVGNNIGPVKNSYFAGSVSGNSYVGGLVGFNGDTVSNCHSTGSVTGREQVGGLLGYHNGIVSNSYSTSSVTGDEYVGGLVGRSFIDYEKGTVSNSFWDTETSGQATSEGGTDKTTAEMMDIVTFSDADWNITTVANPDIRNLSYTWNIVDGVTYPFLSWEPVS